MELVRLIASLEQSAHARDPARRSWDEYLDSLARILALLEVTADGKALERELGKLCASWRAMTSLQVAHDGSWFVPPSGTRTELDRRPSLRGVMAALVAHRRDAPGKPVSTEGLLAAGWPGDRIGDESGRNRVRVAISTVRAMGLRDVLLSRDDGYLLDPDVAISIE